MYSVYILKSISTGRYYVGSTQHPARRLAKHNAGHPYATKAYRRWKVVHLEEYPSRSDAIRREYEIKKMKNRSAIESLLG